MNRQLLILFIGLMLSSCSSNRDLTISEYSNDLFTIRGVTKCKESNTGDAVDSQIGKIECKHISFYYDYGLYGPSGPITKEENFRGSFDAYHYSKFFEILHIDPKVIPIFKDSVDVVEIRAKETVTEKLLFDCDPCNAVADLRFKGDMYHYPTTVSEAALVDDKKDLISDDKINNQRVKLFYKENGHVAAAIYTWPYRKHREFLSIEIIKAKEEQNIQKKILQNILLRHKK